MRRFVKQTLLGRYNTFTKGFPVRLSHFPGNADVKTTNADDALHPRKRGTLIPQGNHLSLPILDSAIPLPTIPPKAEDEIQLSLNSASTLSQLLESISKNVRSMQEEHLASAIDKIINFQKNPRTAFTAEALHAQEGFGKLCHRIRKVAPSMRDPQELVSYLKAMLLCQVGSNTRIVQTLLQMLKGKINDLGIQQIIFLSFLLRKLDGSLVDALKIALPIVFETQLRIQLDLDNVELMRQTLHYATAVRSSPQAIKFIADGLCSNQSWTPSQTCSILWSLGKVRNLHSHGLLPVLDLALSRAGSMVDLCDVKELERTLAVVGENYSAKSKFWYNETLCKATAERVIREKWPFQASLTVGRTFSKMSFVNLKFLDYLSTLIVEARNLSAFQAFHLISPFSVANYKPQNFQSMMDSLLCFDIKTNNFSILLRFALASTVLGVYPYVIIQNLFKEAALEEFLSAKDVTSLDWMQLDLLHRAIRINCSDYPGPYPDKAILEMAKKKHQDVYLLTDDRFPLKAPLETALGGSAYVESGMFTTYGHYVDHVLVLRPGFYPAAINTIQLNSDSVRHVEDVKVPPGCQMLLILVQRPNFFAANAKRLRGMYALEQQTLEKAGYNIVAIDLAKWQSLLEYERIPFLMQEIHNSNVFPDS